MQRVHALAALLFMLASLPASAGSEPVAICSFVEGDLELAASSTLTIDIAGDISGCDPSSVFFTNFDRLFVAGTLNLGGATLKLVLRDGYVPEPGERFPIFQSGTLLGEFGSIDTSMALLPDGAQWDVSALLSDGIVQVPRAPEKVPVPPWALVVGGVALARAGLKGSAART